MSITSEESVSKALDECGTKSGDEGIGFREVICHTCDIVTCELSRGGSSQGANHMCVPCYRRMYLGGCRCEPSKRGRPGSTSRATYLGYIPLEEGSECAGGGGKVGHPISPGEAVGRLGEVGREAWENQEMASPKFWGYGRRGLVGVVRGGPEGRREACRRSGGCPEGEK